MERNIKTWFYGTLTNSGSILVSPAPSPNLGEGHSLKKVTEKEVKKTFFSRNELPDNFYRCTVHSGIHTVHSPTDAHLLKLRLQFTLKLGGSYMFRSTTIIRELAIEPG